MALSLRTKTSLFLPNNNVWHRSWFADPEATEVNEGGDIPTNITSYLAACKRLRKWFDNLNCMAAAEVLRYCLYLQKVVPLTLKAKSRSPCGHFTTLDPMVSVPHRCMEYLRSQANWSVPFFFGGEAKSIGSQQIHHQKEFCQKF